MSTAVVIGATMAAASAMKGYASYQEGKYQGKVADANAAVLRQNAYRKRLETSINEDRVRKENRQKMASNTAAAIEQGMGNSATTVGVLGQQAATLEQNALDLRYQGLSAAENMDIQANYQNQMGKAYRRQGRNAFTMSLINGGLSGISGYLGAGGTFSATPSATSATGDLYTLGGQKYRAYSR